MFHDVVGYEVGGDLVPSGPEMGLVNVEGLLDGIE